MKRFIQDKSGATLAYVSLMLTVLLGITALSFDLGRHYILQTELQKAADAAAIAGAFQLDPNEDDATVQSRVQAAASGEPITGNENTLGNTQGTVRIADVNLLSTIPSDDDTAIGAGNVGPPFNYVSVTTETTTNNNVFGRILGQPAEVTLEATSVAQRGQAICQVTPLAICNPAEASEGAGADFDPADFLGTQILVRQHQGNGTQWAPGNFGFLDVPGFGNGAGGLANALGIGASPVCFGSMVETEPGQTNGARAALNTRFDLYENPFFRNADRDPNFAPAENVFKGFDTTAGNFCNRPEPADPASQPNFRGLPRDTDLSEANRFGNGEWMCADYWQAVHPGVSPPSGCGLDRSSPTSAITRFEVYRFEIDNGLLNAGAGNDFEEGSPQCSQSPGVTPVPGQLQSDRRIITMAVINCVEHGVSGSSTVPVETYLNGFLTEPVNDTPGSTERGDIILEVIGTSRQGEGGVVPVVLREWVEVVR